MPPSQPPIYRSAQPEHLPDPIRGFLPVEPDDRHFSQPLPPRPSLHLPAVPCTHAPQWQ